ncbi:MAG: single-stranded DNA binding protein [Halobacteriota archaeon]
MGAIEDAYEDLDTEVSLEEFREAVERKVEEMAGLADEETAAMLIAHELQDEEVNTIADIAPGMDDVKFMGKVVSIGERRTFERDGDQPDGRVANIEVADETGRIRVSLWDELADAAVGDEETDGQLDVGQVLRIAGRPQDGYNGVEVSADKVEPDADAEIDVQVLDVYRVEDLSLGLSDVNLEGKILDVGEVRTFSRNDGSEGRVANMTLGDPTGRVRLTLWDDQAELVEEYEAGQSIEVVDGYVRERDGDIELHLGSRGAIEALEEPVEYVPETTDIEALEIGQTVDIAGGVIETDPIRTFDRDDGSEGQVRNVRVKDDTGDIRVALWGEKADADIDLADYVVFADVEIKDGWQDDLEASAGWRSTVSVLESDPATSGTPSASHPDDRSSDDGSTGNAGQGLDAFGTDETAIEAENVASDAGAGGTDESGDQIEFTGTVVQAGDPVVLMDGNETRSVRTEASVRLGEEVTVRGVDRNGTIDADEVF